MSNVPGSNHTAPTACFPSFSPDRKTTAVAMVAAALGGGACCFAMTSAQTTDADAIIGVGYGAGNANCDGDTIDQITAQLVLWGWGSVKLYTCLRGLWLATVWFAGTTFSVDLLRKVSTLLGRAPAAAASAAAAAAG